MTHAEFITLVREMRSIQKAYFKRQTPEALQTCKDLERKVDKAIEELTTRQRSLLREEGEIDLRT